LNAIKHLRSIGLQEDPQPPKLNIMVGGGLRFTLVGEGTVQAYCRDNTLKGKPFFCILKDKKQATAKGPSEIDLPEYGVRVKLRREIPLSKDDPRVVDAVTRWASLPKAFRYMQRFSFTSLHWKGLQFDASFVRENRKDTRGNYIQATTFTNAGIVKQPTHYELEVEALSGASKKALIFGIVTVLRGLQKSYILTRESVQPKSRVLQDQISVTLDRWLAVTYVRDLSGPRTRVVRGGRLFQRGFKLIALHVGEQQPRVAAQPRRQRGQAWAVLIGWGTSQCNLQHLIAP
jgi:hypothetical protein